MVDSTKDLTPKQQQELQALVAETQKARQRLERNLRRDDPGAGMRVKETIDDNEYAKRLLRRTQRDQSMVKKVRSERIEKSLKEWRRRVGPTFAEATTDNPVILDRINRLSSGDGTHKTSLVLYGNLGVGKSWSAYSFLNLAISNDIATPGQIIADTETSVLGKITSAGYKKPELLDELLHERNKIWFIDDVGQGFFNDQQKRAEVWFELLDHIYMHQLTLLVTTNLSPFKSSTGRSSPLENWIGPRAFDRLRAIIGHDGLLEPSKINRRERVYEEQETKYLGKNK